MNKKQVDDVIKAQESFIKQTQLTLMFLKIFKGNPEEFFFLIGSDVKEHYGFEKHEDNFEWLWESIDDMTYDMVYGGKNFDVFGTGIFSGVAFSKTKKKNFFERLDRYVKPYSEGKWWI